MKCTSAGPLAPERIRCCGSMMAGSTARFLGLTGAAPPVPSARFLHRRRAACGVARPAWNTGEFAGLRSTGKPSMPLPRILTRASRHRKTAQPRALKPASAQGPIQTTSRAGAATIKRAAEGCAVDHQGAILRRRLGPAVRPIQWSSTKHRHRRAGRRSRRPSAPAIAASGQPRWASDAAARRADGAWPRRRRGRARTRCGGDEQQPGHATPED